MIKFVATTALLIAVPFVVLVVETAPRMAFK